jgi:L-fucose isomerase-like protein
MMKPLTEDGNHTTPGRETPNITKDEIKELEKMADEIMKDAEPCIIDRQYVVNSLIAWKQVQKNMDLYDCSGFVAPCPDACSTRRLNQIQFTFCFTHSMNLEQGFASACEYDVTSAVVMLLLMAVSGKSAYMGNTLPVVATEGRIEWPPHINEAEVPSDITYEDAKHLYTTLHSTPCRHLHGIQKAADKYALRHFAYDQGFGAIQRHEFDDDKGQTITFCRISQDLKQMLIGTGEIAFGVGYDTDNCNGGFVFKVSDSRELFEKQMQFGMHLPIVYGDYADDLAFIAKRMGLEPVIDKIR